jgi:hypothetical protein
LFCGYITNNTISQLPLVQEWYLSFDILVLIKLGMLKVQFLVEFMPGQCLIEGYDLIAVEFIQYIEGLVIEEAARVCGDCMPMDPGHMMLDMREKLCTYGPMYVMALIVVKACYGQGNHYVAQTSALYDT